MVTKAASVRILVIISKAAVMIMDGGNQGTGKCEVESWSERDYTGEDGMVGAAGGRGKRGGGIGVVVC